MNQVQTNIINNLPADRRDNAVFLERLCQKMESVQIRSRMGKTAAIDLFDVGAVTYMRCLGGIWRVRAIKQGEGQS